MNGPATGDSAAWQSVHRGLSEIDLRFREMARSSPDFLDRSRFQALDHNPEGLFYRLQPWLTFLGREKLEDLKRASLGIIGLLRDVPLRVFGKDWTKLADFYRLGSPAIAQILFSPPTGAETMISRGDFIDTASGFKCIEINCTPSLGGWDAGIILRRHLAVPATAQFLAEESIRVASTDPFLEMFRHVFTDLRNKGLAASGEVNVGFVVSPGIEVPDTSRGTALLQHEMSRAIEALGFDLSGRAVSCSYQTLAQRENAVYRDRLKIHALIELHTATPPHIYRLFRSGRVALCNGPMAAILGTKRNLALLSSHAAQGDCSDAERSLIEAHLPWTRLVAPGTVEYEGETRELSDLLTLRQDRFVLKEGDSYGGQAVVLGRSASPEEWKRTLDTALAQGSWIVQEIQESLPYLYQSGDYGCSLHNMIWGPFVFGDRYGGVILRMQPKADGGAVNLSLTATEGVVVEV